MLCRISERSDRTAALSLDYMSSKSSFSIYIRNSFFLSISFLFFILNIGTSFISYFAFFIKKGILLIKLNFSYNSSCKNLKIKYFSKYYKCKNKYISCSSLFSFFSLFLTIQIKTQPF